MRICQTSQLFLVHDAVSNEDIPFATQTDALLASLVLENRIPTNTVDLMLSVLHDPAFDQAQLTLNRATDVFSRVAEHRRLVVATRSAQCHSPPPFPQVILQEVVDILGEERRVLLRERRNVMPEQWPDPTKTPSDSESILRSISLVCRAWTSPDQRAVGRIFCVQELSALKIERALKGSIFGPWTREIMIYRPRPVFVYEPIQDLRHVEPGNLFGVLLARLGNAQSYCLVADTYEEEAIAMLRKTGCLTRLRELRLNGYGSPILLDICEVIKNMPLLKHLAIEASSSPSHLPTIPPSLESWTAPTSLKTLSLDIGPSRGKDSPAHYLSWLALPYLALPAKLKSLNLVCRFGVGMDALKPILGCISHLTITVIDSESASTALAFCTSLEQLEMHLTEDLDFIATRTHFNLKGLSSLKELVLHAHFTPEDRETLVDDIDDSLRRCVTNLMPSSLRVLSVTDVTHYPRRTIIPHAALPLSSFPLTAHLCTERGVVLHVFGFPERR